MANPSIVNATAVGKEVLRRSFIDGGGESAADILIGEANHIYTILSIIVLERSDIADVNFDLYVKPDGGSPLYFTWQQAIPQKGTFVWSDRFVITGTDNLEIEPRSTGGTAAIDVWCTYIDQQFAAP